MTKRHLAAGAVAIIGVALAAAGWAWLQDPARRVQTWLDAHQDLDIVGVGRLEHLPFDIEIYPLTYVTSEGCDFLDQRHPDFVVLDLATILGDDPEELDRFVLGEFNYREVVGARPDAATQALGIVVGKAKAAIAVFERIERPCLRPDEDLSDALRALRDKEDADLRQALASAILRHPVPFKTNLGGQQANIQGVGLRFDGWSRGTEPMAVVYSNDTTSVMQPGIVVGCQASRPDLPVMVIVDDGIERHQRVFGGKGQRALALEPLAPGESRLALVWSDKAWQAPGGDGRWLGASILQATLAAPEAE